MKQSKLTPRGHACGASSVPSDVTSELGWGLWVMVRLVKSVDLVMDGA